MKIFESTTTANTRTDRMIMVRQSISSCGVFSFYRDTSSLVLRLIGQKLPQKYIVAQYISTAILLGLTLHADG